MLPETKSTVYKQPSAVTNSYTHPHWTLFALRSAVNNDTMALQLTYKDVSEIETLTLRDGMGGYSFVQFSAPNLGTTNCTLPALPPTSPPAPPPPPPSPPAALECAATNSLAGLQSFNVS